MIAGALPRGWVRCTLADLGTWKGGGTPSKANAKFWTNGDIPWVSPKDMKAPRIGDAEDHITEEAVRGSATNVVGPGSILVVTRSGILQHSLPVAVTTTHVALNQDLKALEPHAFIQPPFLAFALQRFERDILHGCSKQGTTVQSIETERLLRFEIPVPPLAEQRRIVGALDAQCTRLDAASTLITNLRRRLEQLESQLFMSLVSPAGGAADWGTAKLPSSWAWRRVDELCDHITKGTTPPTDAMSHGPHGIPFLKIQHLNDHGTIRHSDRPVFVSRQTHEGFLARSIVLPGDVLMNIVGPPLGQVGIASDDYPEWNINQAIARFRTRKGLLPRYLASAMRTSSVLRWLQRRAKTTSGQVNLTLATCREMPVPVPPLAVQAELCARFDSIDSQLGACESSCLAAERRCNALRLSILRLAFEGRLVPQDPCDESASVLLDRIRASRAATPPSRKRASKRSPR